jgi:sugar phosphate isomerase/epimerase
MQLGIFTKTFVRPTLEENLDAIKAHGLTAVQYNLESAGGPSMPDPIDPALCDRIRDGLAQRHITLAAVSGTFNIIHPDVQERERGFQRLRVLAAACARLGAMLITFSTGTRDPDYMWGHHPENSSPAAWAEMLKSMATAVQIAADNEVTLVFEPEVSNVVDSAQKARSLLDEIRSPHLQVVIDGANLFHTGELPRMRQILDEAFDLLGPDIALAHAKDLEKDGDAGHQAAGTGVLDYDHYLSLLHAAGFEGALILHSLEEEQVPASRTFLAEKLAPYA